MTADIKTVLTDAQRNRIWLDLTDSGTISKATFNKAVDAIERAVLSAIDSERKDADDRVDALQDMAYSRGLQTGYTMWQMGDEAGYQASLKSREGYVAVLCAASKSSEGAKP